MRRKYLNDGDWNDSQWQEQVKEYQDRRQRNRRFYGIAIAVIGLLWIAKTILNLSFNIDPEMQWPYVLIIIGILIGIKNNFRSAGWWILILIGGTQLVEWYVPVHRDIIWAGVLVIGGLMIAFRPRNKYCKPGFKMDKSVSAESNLNIDVVFGGRKEMITAKDFKSGNISVTFGGCELNFMQADIESTAVLNMQVSFGGIEIIVPSHWYIQNEISPAFGNVEDERNIQTGSVSETKKTLILRGSCSFGNVEIKSY